jgi:hypothetical protein
LNIICHNLLLTNDQFSKLIKIIENNKNILVSSNIIKINKTMSYVTFIMKEIYDYVNMKTSDGTLIMNLKKQKLELEKLKEKINKLNNLILK